MAPSSAEAEEKRKELKAKLAEKSKGSHKAKKETKEQVKKREEAEKAAKEKARQEAEKAAKERAAKAAEEKASPWADENDEASQIGIHLGISCDGCGKEPPIIGKAMKCRDCKDFDLCSACYPERLDKAREAVAAAAGMPGKGRHPASHKFGPRKAAVVMTKEAVAAEVAAAAAADKAAKEKAQAKQQQKASDEDILVEEASQPSNPETKVSKESRSDYDKKIWRPSSRLADLLPTPRGPPRILKP